MTVSDIHDKKFYFFERINRKGIKNAGAESDRFKVWNSDWSLTADGKTQKIKAQENETGIELNLTPIKNRVFHGENGISFKGSDKGNASHYFPLPACKQTVPFSLKGKSLRW